LIEFIRLLDINEGFAVGWRGFIIRYSDSVVSVGENHSLIPEEFNLYQNYPNPFNPSTTIIYEIPERHLVSIAVYDLLGREVAVLINEEKSAGEYEVEFNGSELSSGIYFYQLKAGSFVETKKMILLK
jgi:hypothetical protein